MKKSALNLRGLTLMAGVILSLNISAATWDFSALSSNDKSNLNADSDAWSYDSSNDRWGNKAALNNAALTANGQEISITKGLKVTATGADEVRIDAKKTCFTLNKSTATITIPDLKAGDKVTFVSQCSSKDAGRNLVVTNMTTEKGFDPYVSGDGKVTSEATVTADGDVTVAATGGMYLYSIDVASAGSGDSGNGEYHSVNMNPKANQMLIMTSTGDLKYYDTDNLAEVDFDKEAGSVTVVAQSGEWNDVYNELVSSITFASAASDGSDGEITNGTVNITEAKGWMESCYMKWDLLSNATTYRVYIKGENYADYTVLDRYLVRNYGSYGRADAVGLTPGTYSLKVVPVINGTESQADASVADNIRVISYNRSGFAFLEGYEPGAYQNNGMLKPEARVIYVTAETAKTVTCMVKQSSKDGDGTLFTGLQAILDAYQKGYETRPLAVRFVGLVKKDDLDYISSSAEGLQIKGKNAYSPVHITLEGIGDDATTWGFGFLVRNCTSVEFRNFANMLCMDDCLSFDTTNSHCWVHNMDFFYGQTGSDSDQAKGDGTVDMKANSQMITVTGNHFFDCGKTSLCGMKSESGPNYIDYHHNWFDHTDSRHPRVRTMSVHVWNNYFDGVSKYGSGATMGSSIFVESNYYRASKYPMLISLQGSDISGGSKGTFSSEEGGMIKSFGNVYAEKGSSNAYTPITYQTNKIQFDCYEAATRDEKVPADVKSVSGGNTYDNFDTNPDVMYPYEALDAAAVPAYVTGFYGAGRINHGDFKFDLNYKGSETDANVIKALKEALENYKSPLVGIFE